MKNSGSEQRRGESPIEVVASALGELVIREYEDQDTEAQEEYRYNSSKEFLEGVGFDPTRFKPREQWRADIQQRRNEAKAKGNFLDVVVAELGGRAIAMVFLDQRNADGEPRLHFHIFDAALRGKGLGGPIFMAGVRAFSRHHGIRRFFIEPKATNGPMNRLMRKLGFAHQKDYVVPAGPFTQEMLVSQYEIVCPSSAEPRAPNPYQK